MSGWYGDGAGLDRGNALVQAWHTEGLRPDFLTFCLARGVDREVLRQAIIFRDPFEGLWDFGMVKLVRVVVGLPIHSRGVVCCAGLNLNACKHTCSNQPRVLMGFTDTQDLTVSRHWQEIALEELMLEEQQVRGNGHMQYIVQFLMKTQ